MVFLAAAVVQAQWTLVEVDGALVARRGDEGVLLRASPNPVFSGESWRIEELDSGAPVVYVGESKTGTIPLMENFERWLWERDDSKFGGEPKVANDVLYLHMRMGYAAHLRGPVIEQDGQLLGIISWIRDKWPDRLCLASFGSLQKPAFEPIRWLRSNFFVEPFLIERGGQILLVTLKGVETIGIDGSIISDFHEFPTQGLRSSSCVVNNRWLVYQAEYQHRTDHGATTVRPLVSYDLANYTSKAILSWRAVGDRWFSRFMPIGSGSKAVVEFGPEDSYYILDASSGDIHPLNWTSELTASEPHRTIDAIGRDVAFVREGNEFWHVRDLRSGRQMQTLPIPAAESTL